MSARATLGGTYGVRTVALFEALKGIGGLGGGIGLLILRNRDLEDVAITLINFFHINPEGRISTAMFNVADRISDQGLTLLALGAFVYGLARLIEAYGLWRVRAWAEWFAAVSGCLYVPWEIYELTRRSTGLRWGVFVLNVAIVLYMFARRLKPQVHTL